MLSDDEARPVAVPNLEARQLSLDPRLPDSRRDRGHKHRRESDSMSVESGANAKKADQSRSAEENRR